MESGTAMILLEVLFSVRGPLPHDQNNYSILMSL